MSYKIVRVSNMVEALGLESRQNLGKTHVTVNWNQFSSLYESRTRIAQLHEPISREFRIMSRVDQLSAKLYP